MRLVFLVLVAIAPLDACSDTLVTAPPPPISATTIAIRGAKVSQAPLTMGPQAPLIIVDGVVVDGAVAGRSINPADIEQIEVIKAGAASALYGTEIRCPAIIIHTRWQHSVQMARNAKRQ